MEEEGIDGGGSNGEGGVGWRVSRDKRVKPTGVFVEGDGRRSWSRVGAAPRGPARSRTRPRRLHSTQRSQAAPMKSSAHGTRETPSRFLLLRTNRTVKFLH